MRADIFNFATTSKTAATLVALIAVGLGGSKSVASDRYVFSGSYYSSGSLSCDLSTPTAPPPYGPVRAPVLPPTAYAAARPAYINTAPGFAVSGTFRFSRVVLGRGPSQDRTYSGRGAVTFEEF